MTATNKTLADAKTRLVYLPSFQREVGGEGLTAQMNEGTRGKTGACNKHSLVNDKIAKKISNNTNLSKLAQEIMFCGASPV